MNRSRNNVTSVTRFLICTAETYISQLNSSLNLIQYFKNVGCHLIDRKTTCCDFCLARGKHVTSVIHFNPFNSYKLFLKITHKFFFKYTNYGAQYALVDLIACKQFVYR